MSNASADVIAAFDALPDAERDAVVSELLTRRPIGGGDITDDDYTALADEVFRIFDADEKADDGNPAG